MGPPGDRDEDGVDDAIDNCLDHPNVDQRDTDEDGAGAVCDQGDADGDGVPDLRDDCPRAFDPAQADLDGDGIGPDPQGRLLVSPNELYSANRSPAWGPGAVHTDSLAAPAPETMTIPVLDRGLYILDALLYANRQSLEVHPTIAVRSNGVQTLLGPQTLLEPFSGCVVRAFPIAPRVVRFPLDAGGGDCAVCVEGV